MSGYSTLLFLHVLGALGFFAALGLEWAGLRHVRRATATGQAREWLGMAAAAGRVGGASMAALVATGAYMMATAWGRVVWLSVTVGAVVLMAVLALAITRPRMAAALRSVRDAQERLSSASARSWGGGVLWMSLQLRLGIAVAIVFLMVVKPGITIGVTAVAMGALLGFASGLLTGSSGSHVRPIA
jgi:hypothetical protein